MRVRGVAEPAVSASVVQAVAVSLLILLEIVYIRIVPFW